MAILRADFAATDLQADKAGRTISGVLVPWDSPGTPSMAGRARRVTFAAGSIRPPSNLRSLKLVTPDHDSPPVGYATAAQATSQGLEVTWHIAATPGGDEALLYASEGLRDALSVGAEIDAYDEAPDGSITVTSGTARHGALLAQGAFESALVTDIAAALTQEVPMADETQAQETPVAATAPTVEAATTVPTLVASPPVATIARDAFPYGHPGAEGTSFFKDVYVAGKYGDIEARLRVTKASDMIHAAQTRPDLPEIIPPGYRPDLYVDEINKNRPVVNAFASSTITDATPFTVPVFVSSSGLAVAHVEGVNPSAGTLDLDKVTVTPKGYSGIYDVSREMIDAANPSLDAIIRGALKESYDSQTEIAAAAGLLAVVGVDTGAVVGTTGDKLEGAIRGEIAQFPARRFAPAEVILTASGEFELLVTATATDGRSLLPYLGPTNASGTQGTAASGLSVLGVPIENAWALANMKTVVARRADFYTFESGRLEWRWEEVGGPTVIRFSQWGYFGFAGLRPKGISIITRSATELASSKK